MSWHKTLPLSEVEEHKVYPIQVDSEKIILVRDNDQVYALEDRCSHDNAELEGGQIYEGMVECPRHGALFDFKTGDANGLPAVTGIRTYTVEIRGDIVYVEV